MPIDTAAKRQSVSGVGAATMPPGVTPNASKPEGWRRTVAWTYAFDTVLPPPGPDFDLVSGGWADFNVTGSWGD